jgi:SAM-dependent methyltransferase
MDFQEKEVAKIRERYAKRTDARYSRGAYFVSGLYMAKEKEIAYAHLIREHLGNDLSNKKIMEVGAGGGGNLLFFKKLGFEWKNIYANELLEERYRSLLQCLPNATCIQGDALGLEYKAEFDVVFQSTVFTSILDENFRKALANKMFEMLKPGGIILSYDFVYNNPSNKDVLKLTRKGINALFPNHKKIQFKKVTLAPPVARRIGKLYDIANFLLPALRTHLIAVIKK